VGLGLGYGTARLTQLSEYSGSYFTRIFLEYRIDQHLSLNLGTQPFGPFTAGEYEQPDIELNTFYLGGSYRFPSDSRVTPYIGADINWWDLREIAPNSESLRHTGEAIGIKAGLCISLSERNCLKVEAARQLNIRDNHLDQFYFGLVRYF
jgi:hypothetical protein